MNMLKEDEVNESRLNTLSEAFLRKAFFGLFAKTPNMPTDELLALNKTCVEVMISDTCHLHLLINSLTLPICGLLGLAELSRSSLST